jgi:hypothetical protein
MLCSLMLKNLASQLFSTLLFVGLVSQSLFGQVGFVGGCRACQDTMSGLVRISNPSRFRMKTSFFIKPNPYLAYLLLKLCFLVVAKDKSSCHNLFMLAVVPFSGGESGVPGRWPNTACSRRLGVCAIYKHFPGFEFILLSSSFPASRC